MSIVIVRQDLDFVTRLRRLIMLDVQWPEFEALNSHSVIFMAKCVTPHYKSGQGKPLGTLQSN